MLRGDAVEARDEFIDARVVLHGAGAERIHAQIDGVVPGGKAREVADDFDFADFGETFDAGRAVMFSERFADRRREHRAAADQGRACPAADFSKMSPSFWLMWRETLLMSAFIMNPWAGKCCDPGQFLLS